VLGFWTSKNKNRPDYWVCSYGGEKKRLNHGVCPGKNQTFWQSSLRHRIF
jgi:hypothetical protein